MPLRSLPWRWWGKNSVQAPELSWTLQYTAPVSCATSAHIQPERLKQCAYCLLTCLSLGVNAVDHIVVPSPSNNSRITLNAICIWICVWNNYVSYTLVCIHFILCSINMFALVLLCHFPVRHFPVLQIQLSLKNTSSISEYSLFTVADDFLTKWSALSTWEVGDRSTVVSTDPAACCVWISVLSGTDSTSRNAAIWCVWTLVASVNGEVMRRDSHWNDK